MQPGAHVASIVKGLKRDGLDELIPSLAITRDSVESWWKTPRMPWFTDHGAAHSKRVAGHAHRLATVRALPDKLALSPQEQYLLEMAAWVHDVGMQAIASPDASSAMYPSDPNTVRQNHPRQSFEIVMGDDKLKLGLPSNYDSTLEFIAWLALSHGTETYSEAVVELRKTPRLNQQRVRGPLLASLLLMADEVDLHSERVRSHGAIEEFGAVSNAHWLKHECVDDVQINVVDSGDGDEIRIEITLKKFHGMSPQQFDAIRKWICDKLVRQIALVQPEITKAWENHYKFDRSVFVALSALGGRTNPRIANRVMAVIEADNAKEVLINHADCLKHAKQALESGRSVVVVGEVSGEDEDGREDIYELLCAEHRLVGIAASAPRESGLGSNRTAADVLSVLLSDLGGNDAAWSNLHETVRREFVLDALHSSASKADAAVLFAISGVDELPEAERDWLIATAVPRLLDVPNAKFLVTVRDASDGPATSAEYNVWVPITVGTTPSDALTQRLTRYMSHAAAVRLVARGIKYGAVKSYGFTEATGVE